ncbi:hypothetical protein BKA67DRAFT_529077 [Truncatella angustata]|uniref:Uncharacterized protein n=1 Tax=Truncatella angustata TaxID=152316 RepID=A0A9P8UUS0_9PEZI|nr:uncharacterized protein BKA67DRAFT_529077 [Truncatella angustata]KAH6658886.1 hypothetical protein BKA67DRAFT_529077 [Truncatella angustata]
MSKKAFKVAISGVSRVLALHRNLQRWSAVRLICTFSRMELIWAQVTHRQKRQESWISIVNRAILVGGLYFNAVADFDCCKYIDGHARNTTLELAVPQPSGAVHNGVRSQGTVPTQPWTTPLSGTSFVPRHHLIFETIDGIDFTTTTTIRRSRQTPCFSTPQTRTHPVLARRSRWC